MLGDKGKSILDDNPEILRRESMLTRPAKKRGRWILKAVFGLIAIGLLYYLFKHPEMMSNPVDKFFERFT